MGKKSCLTLKELETEIVRRADIALKKDVAPYVKDKLKKHIQTDVYAKYTPVMYERRKDDGGLLDDSGNEPSIQVSVRPRELTVYERAKPAPPLLENHKEYSNKDGLARLLEEGPYNPWGSQNVPWARPRRFMTKTQKEINAHPADIKKMIKNRIEHDSDS